MRVGMVDQTKADRLMPLYQAVASPTQSRVLVRAVAVRLLQEIRDELKDLCQQKRIIRQLLEAP